MVYQLVLLFFCSYTKDNRRCPQRDDSAVLYAPAFAVAKNFCTDKCTRAARRIAKGEEQFAALVCRYFYATMERVHAGVYGLDGAVDIAAPYVASHHVCAFMERYDLLEMKSIFYHQERTHNGLFFLLGRILARG